MKDIKKYIDSGIIEMYVLGLATMDEIGQVHEMAASYPEIQKEIDEVSAALSLYNKANVTLSSHIKPLLMAVIDYTERLKAGEVPVTIPVLTEKSKISDYFPWINRVDMVLDSDDDAYAKLIGYSPEAMTAIAWLRNEMPYEVHEKEYEKLLILEGSCDVIFSDRVVSLVPGDYFCIPLHTGHTIKITSRAPCKVILQRSAA